MSKDYSEYFYYDETSPTFLRHKEDKWGGESYKIKVASANQVAGSVNNEGYFNVKIDGKTVKAHKIVLALHGITISKMDCVDHIDGNRSNNQIDNLRVVHRKQNARNVKMLSSNKSGISGVGWVVNKQGGNTYAYAKWQSINGTRNSGSNKKYFSVDKLGIMVAFRDAVIYRQKMIEELNSQGAGYTERHGLQEKLK